MVHSVLIFIIHLLSRKLYIHYLRNSYISNLRVLKCQGTPNRMRRSWRNNRYQFTRRAYNLLFLGVSNSLVKSFSCRWNILSWIGCRRFIIMAFSGCFPRYRLLFCTRCRASVVRRSCSDWYHFVRLHCYFFGNSIITSKAPYFLC